MHSEDSDELCRRRKGLLYTGLASDNAVSAPQTGNLRQSSSRSRHEEL